MYLSFYGLREPPFELTSDPKFLHFTEQHREALSILEYGLSSSKAVTVLVGDAGTGKTTVLQAALKSEHCRGVRTVFLNNPALTRAEFIETLASQFQLNIVNQSKASLLTALEPVLRDRRQRGETSALVIDEAQSLSYELLEEIRLLTNMETPTDKLLPIALAGQPELTARLNEAALEPLKQRVALRGQMGPLTLRDTAGYISSRIRTAGGDSARLFSREAVALVHEHSRGIPRTINVICDNALVTGFGRSQQPINREIVLEVCRDLDLRAPTASSPDGAMPRPANGNLLEYSRADSHVNPC
jgi:general secretion pathway protein A